MGMLAHRWNPERENLAGEPRAHVHVTINLTGDQGRANYAYLDELERRWKVSEVLGEDFRLSKAEFDTLIAFSRAALQMTEDATS